MTASPQSLQVRDDIRQGDQASSDPLPSGGGDDRRGEPAIVDGGGTRLMDGLVLEPGGHYTRVCVRHQVASLTVGELALLEDWTCSLCVAEAEAFVGRKRYVELHGRLATD